MLGSVVVSYLSQDPDLEVTATVRTEELATECRGRLPAASWRTFDADAFELWNALEVIDGHDWVINAIGIIKPLIHDDNASEVERAVRINSLLPPIIARRAQASGARILSIATDCVYSGSKGSYVENDEHDALDVYGKTKSLGEVPAPHVHHLRCSIIGPEMRWHRSLLDWFLGQPRGAGVSGYVNHSWNGVTTLHFAMLCRGIVVQNIAMPHLQHVVPAGEVTKCELLQCFSKDYRRQDVSITPAEASVVVDRTLATTEDGLNQDLWAAAGYPQPPSVPEMVSELAVYRYPFSGL